MSQAETIASAIDRSLTSPNQLARNPEAANVVDGLYAIARALSGCADAINRLGNADACTSMGGLEALGGAVKDGLSDIASAILTHEA